MPRGVVLPRMALADDATAGLDDTFNHTVSALRPLLRCIQVEDIDVAMRYDPGFGDLEPSNYDRWNDTVDFAVDNMMATFRIPVPTGCVADDDFATDENTLVYEYKRTVTFGSDLAHVGKLVHLSGSAASVSLEECPSALFLLARPIGDWNLPRGDDDNNNGWPWKATEMTALACSQHIEQVPASVMFRQDSGFAHLIPSGVVVLHDDGAERVANATTGATSLGYRLPDFYTNGGIFGGTEEHDGEIDDETGRYVSEPVHLYGRFFNHLIFGHNGVSVEAIAGPANLANFSSAVARDYGQMLQHIIDRNLRPLSTQPSVQIVGELKRRVLRLAIHRPSKITLQAVLAAMIILGLTGRLLVRLEGVLPRNPCSIGSVMALLAGSQVCDPTAGVLPVDGQKMKPGELGEALSGWVFSLGWWEDRSVSEAQRRSQEAADTPFEEGAEESAASEHPGPTTKMLTERTTEKRVSDGVRFGIDVGQAGPYRLL
ncbi:hypothetical protein F5X68DRAFT_250905 [Plectosphaerella plurivora]|uniref:Uncharacterized protein n=1 Tax=Plectosphaerella plurivora TaxID=936078 RepID=A0A9P9ABF5_9PEZI|nr:hypothetical protein F5X68DRAFT_250905 [Plectosphaerella plurivora]